MMIVFTHRNTNFIQTGRKQNKTHQNHSVPTIAKSGLVKINPHFTALDAAFERWC